MLPRVIILLYSEKMQGLHEANDFMGYNDVPMFNIA